jgi:hypothetical protein
VEGVKGWAAGRVAEAAAEGWARAVGGWVVAGWAAAAMAAAGREEGERAGVG